jgi:8-oxo-dGTP pyrophosphatase MutT (NUDIX family)
MDPWKPNTTVAAVVERDGRFLLVEELTRDGLRLNQPAGHLERGESLAQAVAREALEETAHRVEPVALVGVYMARLGAASPVDDAPPDTTYVRYAFACRVLAEERGRALDEGIVRALWLGADELRAAAARHRSPLVQAVVDDYLAGRRFPLDLIRTDPSVVAADAAGGRRG